MLRDLHVSDFALIEDLHIEFGVGLNVVTGETGAGKSLLQRAVAIALGARTGPDVIRAGREAARIEARFTWTSPPPGLESRLAGREVPLDGDGLVVRRTVARSGRGTTLLNGRSAPVAALVEAGETLAQMQGQHESLRLAQPEAHLGMLDEFAGTTELAERYRASHARVLGLVDRLDVLERGAAELERRLELARYDLEELERAQLVDPEETESLASERSRLRNAEKLASAAAEALDRLQSGEGAALGLLERHATRIRELASLDPALDPIAALLEQAASPLADGMRDLQDYLSDLDGDPSRLEALEERLALLERLRRKHDVPDVAGLIGRRDELAKQVERHRRDSEDPGALREELARAAEAAWQLADELSEERREASSRLSKAMGTELASLGMAEARFLVDFEALAPGASRGAAAALVRNGRALGPEGPLRIEFHLEANRGEGARPLARVASGGELSRLMLALRNVTGGGSVPTLVFDEVDAGIGGAAAEIVGRRLRDLGSRHQVICITHLAQIAAFADRHYAVAKSRAGGRTQTQVVAVEGEERERELARMLGGAEPGTEALRHAAEMLRRARGTKEKTPSAAPRARAASRGKR